MKLVNNIKDADYITHSGTMHADEVFSTAFLDLYKKDIKVFRTTDIDNIKDKFLYDIGRGEFDHHQEDARIRDNGIKYCSFGLIFEKYGKDYLNSLNINNIDDVYNEIVKDFIEQIDAIDNGQFPKIDAKYKVMTLSDMFKLFNPGFKSNETPEEGFIKAVEVAKIILQEEIINVTGKIIAKEIVLNKVNNTNKNYIILDEYMPYEDTILNEEKANNIYFVLYPSTRGGYCLKTVPKSIKEKSSRMEIPKEWAGKTDDELVNITKIDDLTFCHSGRFLICSNTKESIIKAAETIIENNK